MSTRNDFVWVSKQLTDATNTQHGLFCHINVVANVSLAKLTLATYLFVYES